MMRPRMPLLAAGLWTLAAALPLGLVASAAPWPTSEARPQEQEVERATALTAITAEDVGGDVVVRLAANGRLVASTVQIPDGAPPRLALDFTGVTSRTPGRIAVGKGMVNRVRVAEFSASPLVTRVVLDLDGTFIYKVRPAENQRGLVVTIGDPDVRARRDDEAVSRAFARVGPPRPTVSAAPAVVAAAAAPSPAAPEVAPVTPPAAVAPAAAPVVAVAPAAPAATAPAATPAPSAAQTRVVADDLARAACDTAFETYPISMDFDGVDLNAILRTFSEVAGVNLVIDPDVKGTVNIKLKDVPWNQALAVVLRTNGLACVPTGSIVRIAPRGTLTTELNEGTKLRQAQADEERNRLRQTRVLQLSYAKAQDVAPLLDKSVLTAGFGTFQVDEKTNVIILNDLPEAIAAAEALVAQLDAAPQQVEIEARMVITTTEFAKRLGVRLALRGRATPELGNTTGLAFPNSIDAFGSAGPSAGLPRDSIDIMMGAINGVINLDVALAALERDENVKVILRPRVVTQNNTQAIITRGVEIPYTTVAAPPQGGGVQILQPIPQVQFKAAALTMTVTPQITAANTVILDVDVDNGSPVLIPEANGNRAVNTQRVQTRVLVADGGTTVIGGISEDNEGNLVERTPFLHRIPLLGNLFKQRENTVINEELLVFITPRILRDGGPVK